MQSLQRPAISTYGAAGASVETLRAVDRVVD